MKVLILLTLIFNQIILAENITNTGWPEKLAPLYYRLKQTQHNYFVLVSKTPSHAMDFRSGERIKDSISGLDFQNNFVPGHEMVGWMCRVGDDSNLGFIGVSGENKNQTKKMVDLGWGLTSFAATFTDGFVQSYQDIQQKLIIYQNDFEKDLSNGHLPKHDLIITVIEITDNDCDNLINSIHTYIGHPNNPTEKFGLALNPETFEGAGCGSFANYLLSQIQSLKDITPLFKRTFEIPLSLFGKGDSLPQDTEIPERLRPLLSSKKIGKIALTNRDWSPSEFGNYPLSLIDPEMVLVWQKTHIIEHLKLKNSKEDLKTFRQRWDRGVWEKVPDYDVPYIWSWRPIDKDFDDVSEKIHRIASQQIKKYRSELVFLNNFPILILEK